VKTNWKTLFFWVLVAFLFALQSACSLGGEPVETPSLAPPSLAPVFTPTILASPLDMLSPTSTKTLIPPTETPSLTPQPTLTDTPTITPSSTPTPTQTPTDTTTPTITPTWAVLRGKVIPERANCRYGPGAPYLYKYGLVGGSNLEIIGRNALGTWILIQAIGGSNPCWVKTNLMEIRGEVMGVAPVDPDIIQAWSPYYAPLTNVSAIREGDKVTVSWSPLVLRAGDDAEQTPYVLEAWICQEGELVFIPVGAYTTAVEVTDEQGCPEPSHGQVLAAEKHGYTRPSEVPWP